MVARRLRKAPAAAAPAVLSEDEARELKSLTAGDQAP